MAIHGLLAKSSDNRKSGPQRKRIMTLIHDLADTKGEMIKPSRPNTGEEMVTVYGKVPRKLAERLDELAAERRWSRAQMVAYCIEQFIERGGSGKRSE